MISPQVQKTIQTLRKANLSQEDRIALTTVLLDSLSALPLGKIVVVSPNGVVKINGKDLDKEQSIAFSESCAALKDNFARKVIKEQVKFMAIELGVHKGQSLDTIMFSKAALWCINEEDKLINLFK